VTVKELAEIGDISEATVRKIVQDRPDIFVKRESRQYEIRDPQADRKADK
jgi:predicted transcriptional regulator